MASNKIDPLIPTSNVPLVNPANISKFFNPKGYFPLLSISCLEITPAINPNTNDIQSKAICNESESNPNDLDLNEYRN